MTTSRRNRGADAASGTRTGGGFRYVIAWLAALGLCAGPARAADIDTLQEVVVTAQKREQKLQDVGVSVTALQSDDLRSLGITDTLQLGAAAPALQLNGANGNYGAQLTIRGVAQSDFSPHQESPNSMYIDEVYLSAPNAQGSQMFDMERVEVLRGPQGTLFGRNSTGGLVNFITKKPTADTQGYVDVTGGEFNEFRVEAAIGGALSDRVRARLAVATQDNDGYVTNHYPGAMDLNSTHFQGVRAEIAVDLTDKLKMLVTLPFSHDRDREGFYGNVTSYFDPNNSGRPTPLPANIDAWGTGPGNDLQGYRSPYKGNEGSISYVGRLSRGVAAPTIRFDWDLGGSTLTSITNFTKLNFNYDEDCSGAPQFTCQDPYAQNLKQWSQELRLGGVSGPLTWITGAYALHTDQQNFSAFIQPDFAGTPFAFHAFNTLSQKLTSMSVFGQAEYLFTPSWRGTLGLRVTHDDKDFSSQTYLVEAGDYVSTDTFYNPPLQIYDYQKATVGSLANETNTYLTGKAQLDYILSKNALLYASISRGAKGAGFNSNATGAVTNDITRFRGEKMNAYEAGEKLTLLNGRLTLNSEAFYYDYKDYQAYQYLVGPNPYVSNDDARFVGAEIEVAIRPVRGLDIHLSVAGLSAVLYDVATHNIGVVNQQPTDAPKWSGNGLVRYTWPVAGGSASVQWSSDYVGNRFHSVDNTPVNLVHSSIGHNARVGYAVGRWDVSAQVNNLTNSIRQTGAYDLTAFYGYVIQTFMPPRWWSASVRYSF